MPSDRDPPLSSYVWAYVSCFGCVISGFIFGWTLHP